VSIRRILYAQRQRTRSKPSNRIFPLRT